MMPGMNLDSCLITEDSDVNTTEENIYLPFTEYNYLDEPQTNDWSFKPLYDTNINGRISMWQIGYDSSNERLVYRFGLVDGQIQEGYVPIIPKGKLDHNGQALLEARKRYRDKYEIDGKRPLGDETEMLTKVSLANTYYPPGTNDGKNKPSNLSFPVSVQAKFDGVRATFIRDSSTDIKCLSRNLKPMYFLDHIIDELKSLFTFLPATANIDGELYLHGYSQQKIRGMVLRTVNKHPKIELVKLHIFDIMMPETSYNERYLILIKAYKEYLELRGPSNTFSIVYSNTAYSHEDLYLFLNYFTQLGYEGIIIRQLAVNSSTRSKSLYKSGKSVNMLKYKKHLDDEGIIIDVLAERTKDDTNDMAIFRLSYNGVEFNVRPTGEFETRIQMYQDRDMYIGKEYTFKYFNLSDEGIPICPIGVAVREVGT